MNKEELRNCFDAITPTDEQKEKMLSEILKHKRNVFKPTEIYKYAAAFAAVLAIGILISNWPQLQNFEDKNTAGIYSYDSGQKTAEKTENSNVSDMSSEKSAQKATDKTSENAKVVSDKTSVKSGGKTSESNSDISKEGTNVEQKKTAELNGQTKSGGLVVFKDIEPSANESSGSTADSTKEADNNDTSMKVALAPEEGYAGKIAASGTDADQTKEADKNDTSMRAALAPEVGITAASEPGYRQMTYDEIMKDETYGKLFPKRILEGFGFVGAQSINSTLDADFKGKNGSMHIRIYNKANADSSLATITPNELLTYKNVNNMSFSVLCGNYVVFYEINGNNISGIYDMVVSTTYFKK